MQFRAEKQLSHGLSYLLAYTTGKRIDDTSPVNAGWGALGSSFQNFNNLRLERSLSTRDVAQRLSLAFQYELPFGAGKALGAGLPRPVSKLVSGWQAMGITTLQSGSPLALTTSVNNTNSFGGGSRPNSTGRSAKLEGPIRERLDRFFDVSAFTLPAQFAFGNVSHTLPDVREPGLVNQDFSLVKDTKINERYSIQFRAEAFNFLNNVSFGRPGTAIGSPGAGVIATAGDARILQFALKLMY
jgi:hypothetical protein